MSDFNRISMKSIYKFIGRILKVSDDSATHCVNLVLWTQTSGFETNSTRGLLSFFHLKKEVKLTFETSWF
jgi:hypothetical protein